MTSAFSLAISPRRRKIVVVVVVSSRRNKTNPHRIGEYFYIQSCCSSTATHVQAFKPKLAILGSIPLKTDHLSSSSSAMQQPLKHFQPHSLLCHLWCSFVVDSFGEMSMISMTCYRSSFDNHFFLHHRHWFHMSSQLLSNSHTSRTIVSSQYHPRETRPLLGEWNL